MNNSRPTSGVVLRNTRIGFSLRINPRVPVAFVLLGSLLAALAVWSIGIGAEGLSPGTVISSLLGRGDPTSNFIVNELRLPRVAIAVLEGVALATAGAILQGVSRNPLAAPEIIGITAGANLAVVITLFIFAGVPFLVLSGAALVGGIAASVIVYLLAWNGGSSPTRLILIGVGISMAMQAVVMGVVLSMPIYSATTSVVFMSGSVYGLTWTQLGPMAVITLLLLPLVYLQSKNLDALQMGDDMAGSLGLRLEVNRLILVVLAVALASTSVAVAGPITFVGLMAPHMTRFIVGGAHSAVLPITGLLGGIIVLASDTLARTVFAPIDIPVGVVTAIVGVPYFLYLLFKSQNTERGI